MIEEQENDLFKVIRNETENCFDILLKKEKYETTSELLGIISWIHQLGIHSKEKLRIGASKEWK